MSTSREFHEKGLEALTNAATLMRQMYERIGALEREAGSGENTATNFHERSYQAGTMLTNFMNTWVKKLQELESENRKFRKIEASQATASAERALAVAKAAGAAASSPVRKLVSAQFAPAPPVPAARPAGPRIVEQSATSFDDPRNCVDVTGPGDWHFLQYMERQTKTRPTTLNYRKEPEAVSERSSVLILCVPMKNDGIKTWIDKARALDDRVEGSEQRVVVLLRRDGVTAQFAPITDTNVYEGVVQLSVGAYDELNWWDQGNKQALELLQEMCELWLPYRMKA
jgi:hypothetical protein